MSHIKEVMPKDGYKLEVLLENGSREATFPAEVQLLKQVTCFEVFKESVNC